ncbi:MAG TPA: hypothetical protein VFO49_17560 [Nocardioides sp.]|nr:hypothetical protein [Nocardioides sp.]
MTLPRLLLLVLLLFACSVLGVGVVAVSEREEAPPRDPVPASGPVTGGPVAVLHEWDRRRAHAWAAGDVRALLSLYTRRSRAGDRDAARLSRWLDRGVRVRRLETQVLDAEVTAWHRDRVVLSVTDRVARAVATGGVALPDDSPSTWRITMRRVEGEWRVASVRS